MNRNRMENDRDPGIWNRNGRDDQQKRLIKELKVEINRSIKLYFLSSPKFLGHKIELG
eukprot:UN1745